MNINNNNNLYQIPLRINQLQGQINAQNPDVMQGIVNELVQIRDQLVAHERNLRNREVQILLNERNLNIHFNEN